MYREVFEEALADWSERVDKAAGAEILDAWDKVDHVVSAAFAFFVDNPDFVRILRREALDGTNHLGIDIGAALRPLFQRAVGYFEREMEAGQFRRQDPEQLVLTGYGALLTLLLRRAVPHRPARSQPAVLGQRSTQRLAHVRDFFRAALDPDAT